MDSQNQEVDPRFETWCIFPKAVEVSAIAETQQAYPFALMVHDKSDTDQKTFYFYGFDDAISGQETYHQLLIDRSLHHLFTNHGGTNSAEMSDDPIPNYMDPFTGSFLRKMCEFHEDDNKKFNIDFGSVWCHLQCRKDKSFVRYTRARHRLTNQQIMIRLEAYVHETSRHRLGTDPQILSEVSSEHFVRHFHSWTDKATIRDPFSNLGNITVHFVCSAAAVPTSTLEELIETRTLTVSSVFEIASQVARLADEVQRGFYDQDGNLTAYEIGPILVRNIFLDFRGEVGVVQIANLNEGVRYDELDSNVPFRYAFCNDSLNVGALIITLLLCTIKNLPLRTAEMLTCCIMVNVTNDYRDSGTPNLWEIFLKIIETSEMAIKLLKSIFRRHPKPLRFPELSEELKKYPKDDSTAKLGMMDESILSEIVNAMELLLKYFQDNSFRTNRFLNLRERRDGPFRFIEMFTDLAYLSQGGCQALINADAKVQETRLSVESGDDNAKNWTGPFLELDAIYSVAMKQWRQSGDEYSRFLEVLLDLAYALPVGSKLVTDEIVLEFFFDLVPHVGNLKRHLQTLKELNTTAMQGFEENIGTLFDEIYGLFKILLPGETELLSELNWRTHTTSVFHWATIFLEAAEIFIEQTQVTAVVNSAAGREKWKSAWWFVSQEQDRHQNSHMYVTQLMQDVRKRRRSDSAETDGADFDVVTEEAASAMFSLSRIFHKVYEKLEPGLES